MIRCRVCETLNLVSSGLGVSPLHGSCKACGVSLSEWHYLSPPQYDGFPQGLVESVIRRKSNIYQTIGQHR